MAIAFGTAGVAATGTTSLTCALPASIAAGDLLILSIVNKYPTNGPTRPSGWTLAGQANGGVGAAGADSGSVYTTVYYRVATGTENADWAAGVAVTITSGNCAIGRITRWTKAVGKRWELAVATGSDNTAGTAFSVTAGSNPGLAPGDLLVMSAGTNTDARTYSAEAVTATGVSAWGTVTERNDSVTANGDDCALVISDHPVSTGTASAAPVFTMTASGTTGNQNAGSAVFVRLREVDAATITKVDPTTKALTGFYRGAPSGDVMSGTASAGSSGARTLAAPLPGGGGTSGTSLNGHPSTDYNGSQTANSLSGTGETLGNYFGASGNAWSAWIVFEFDALGADAGGSQGNRWLNPGVFDDSGGTYLQVNGSTAGLTVGVSDANSVFNETLPIAIAAATKYLARLKGDGTDLFVKVNNDSHWNTVSCAAIHASGLAGILREGATAGGAFDGRRWSFGIIDSLLSDADFDGIGAYEQDYFATSFGFVVASGTMVGAATGAATTTGVMRGTSAMAGVSNASATTVGVMRGTSAMAGSATGVATTDGKLSVLVAGSTTGVAATSGVMFGRGALVGASNAAATTSGVLAGAGRMAGASSGAATCTGALRGFAYGAGVCNAGALTTGVLVGRGFMAGAASGGATCTGILFAKIIDIVAHDTARVRSGTRANALVRTASEDEASVRGGVQARGRVRMVARDATVVRSGAHARSVVLGAEP